MLPRLAVILGIALGDPGMPAQTKVTTTTPDAAAPGLVVRAVPPGPQPVYFAAPLPWPFRCNAVRRSNCSP